MAAAKEVGAVGSGENELGGEILRASPRFTAEQGSCARCHGDASTRREARLGLLGWRDWRGEATARVWEAARGIERVCVGAALGARDGEAHASLLCCPAFGLSDEELADAASSC